MRRRATWSQYEVAFVTRASASADDFSAQLGVEASAWRWLLFARPYAAPMRRPTVSENATGSRGNATMYRIQPSLRVNTTFLDRGVPPTFIMRAKMRILPFIQLKSHNE